MCAPLPDSARVDVEPLLARALFNRAESLPRYDNKEFYSAELQWLVYQSFREEVRGFDSFIAKINQRLRVWPYCALVRGLTFDEGNKVFVGVNRAFGELVARPYEAPRAQLVHYIQPATAIVSRRGGHERERLHADTAAWEPRFELISMVGL